MANLADVHEKVLMTPPSADDAVEIGVELATVIKELWRLGFTTLMSCQDLGEAIAACGTTTRNPVNVERGGVSACPCCPRCPRACSRTFFVGTGPIPERARVPEAASIGGL